MQKKQKFILFGSIIILVVIVFVVIVIIRKHNTNTITIKKHHLPNIKIKSNMKKNNNEVKKRVTFGDKCEYDDDCDN